jgi:predicted HTH domain antitoxin
MRLTLEVPDAANISQTDAQILFAMKLFEADKLSLGKAAETAGLSYRTFYELLVRYGIPVVTMTEEDVKWKSKMPANSEHVPKTESRGSSPDTIINSDTACLIGLTDIGQLDLLQAMYRSVLVTLEIAEEYGDLLPE